MFALKGDREDRGQHSTAHSLPSSRLDMLSSTALKFAPRLAVRTFASFGDQIPNASSQMHNKETWGMEMAKNSSGNVPGNPGGDPGKRNQRDDPTNAFTGVKGVKYNIQDNDMDDGSGLVRWAVRQLFPGKQKGNKTETMSSEEQQVMSDVNQAEMLRDEDPAAADADAKKEAVKDQLRDEAIEAGEPTKQDGKNIEQMRPDLRGGHLKEKEGPSITFPETMATPRDELKH